MGRNPHIADYENWLALDANLSPGSGGSAIVNAKGEIIGMGVGSSSTFAIPINTVRQIAAELIAHGTVTRGWLGVSIQEIDSGLAEEIGFGQTDGCPDQ